MRTERGALRIAIASGALVFADRLRRGRRRRGPEGRNSQPGRLDLTLLIA